MKKQQSEPADDAALRRRAEVRVGQQKPAGGLQRTESDETRLIHELQVHKIELEMQQEELQQARGQMETLLAQYTDLYDFAPVSYLTLDRTAAVRQVNLTAARLLGIERSRLVDRRFSLFVAERDRGAFSDFLQTAFASEAKACCEVALCQADSRPLVVEIEGVRSGDGQECRAVVFDVTERRRMEEQTRRLLAEVEASRRELLSMVEDQKQTEAALSRLNAELEQRVLVRTAELTAANQELDSFAYAVSHDLRAPLRAMSGFSLLLIEDYEERLPAGARDLLAQIRQAGQNMGRLIDGLLVLSRSTRGELLWDSVDLSALATRVCQDLALAEPARTVRWQVEEGLTARGDGRLLEAMLRNLLGNAWKYTTNCAAPEVRVYAEREGEAVCYCVTDNGAGFDMRHAGRLFKPFQRLHRQDEFQGIGIGLATVQRIVQRHGGTISATAAVNQGATFRVCLPSAGTGRNGVHWLAVNEPPPV
jgi:PAS domain S-box-containing protein